MRSWLNRTLSERARLFLLSLAMAVTMWYYVGTTTRPADGPSPTASLRLYSLEVTISGTPEGWRASANPPSVDIEMRWPAQERLAVGASDVRAIADVSSLAPGSHQVTLRIQVPSGVTAVQADPPAVTVTLIRP